MESQEPPIKFFSQSNVLIWLIIIFSSIAIFSIVLVPLPSILNEISQDYSLLKRLWKLPVIWVLCASAVVLLLACFVLSYNENNYNSYEKLRSENKELKELNENQKETLNEIEIKTEEELNKLAEEKDAELNNLQEKLKTIDGELNDNITKSNKKIAMLSQELQRMPYENQNIGAYLTVLGYQWGMKSNRFQNDFSALVSLVQQTPLDQKYSDLYHGRLSDNKEINYVLIEFKRSQGTIHKELQKRSWHSWLKIWEEATPNLKKIINQCHFLSWGVNSVKSFNLVFTKYSALSKVLDELEPEFTIDDFIKHH